RRARARGSPPATGTASCSRRSRRAGAGRSAGCAASPAGRPQGPAPRVPVRAGGGRRGSRAGAGARGRTGRARRPAGPAVPDARRRPAAAAARGGAAAARRDGAVRTGCPRAAPRSVGRLAVHSPIGRRVPGRVPAPSRPTGAPAPHRRRPTRPKPRRSTVQTPSGHPVESTSAARVVVLVSGAGSNLAAILAAHDDAAYGARVVGVVSDKADAGGLDLARRAGVAAVTVAPGNFADRAAWNEAVAQAVDVFRPDLVVLAGFMRILGPAFVGRFAGRTINTHPALLPSFPGAHGVRDALAYGVRVTGCTVHVVDDGVDTGPIVAQVAVPVEDGDDEESLHERIKVAERALLVETVGRVAREGMRIEGRRVVLGGAS